MCQPCSFGYIYFSRLQRCVSNANAKPPAENHPCFTSCPHQFDHFQPGSPSFTLKHAQYLHLVHEHTSIAALSASARIFQLTPSISKIPRTQRMLRSYLSPSWLSCLAPTLAEDDPSKTLDEYTPSTNPPTLLFLNSLLPT